MFNRFLDYPRVISGSYMLQFTIPRRLRRRRIFQYDLFYVFTLPEVKKKKYFALIGNLPSFAGKLRQNSCILYSKSEGSQSPKHFRIKRVEELIVDYRCDEFSVTLGRPSISPSQSE